MSAVLRDKRITSTRGRFGSGDGARRDWKELRIRAPDLVKDNVTLPIQRLREAVSDLIKTSDDKEIGQELIECNRRLGELKVEVAEFLSQQADDHVYWVERSGKATITNVKKSGISALDLDAWRAVDYARTQLPPAWRATATASCASSALPLKNRFSSSVSMKSSMWWPSAIFVAPASIASTAARRMTGGVSKSGSPVPRSMIDRPAARSAFARCETAIVTDSLSCAMFDDGRNAGGVMGGQLGVRAGQKLRAEQLRALLAVIVLAVAIRLLFDLLLTPSELYSIVSARNALTSAPASP